MKRIIVGVHICIGLITAAVCQSSASPLQHGDVPADLAWMVHLDCDNLRGTALGQSLLTELDKPDLKEKLDGIQSMFTFDPRKQLHGLTLYNTGKATEDGVLLLYADFEAARLENLAKSAKDYKSASHKQHTIHSWVDEKKRASARARTYASIYRNRLIVFGQAESRVAAALDALDHSVPVLTPTNALVRFADGGNGSFLVASARKLDLSPSDPNAAAIFRSTKVFRLQLAENQRQMNGTMTLDTNDEEVAKTIASIGQGLIGLLKLQQEKTEAVKLAEALSLKQEGAGIVVNLNLPADDVTTFIKNRLKKETEKSQKAEKAEKAEEEEKK